MESLKTPIGDIVSNNFRTAELFKKAGMDFCCGRNITLEEACRQKGLNPKEFIEKINRITNGYDLPEDACNTYSVCFRMLSLFEDDLHIHVHLENNILFKKALEL
jgi:iron-sulfur cluster repair protein YtfE (RIC family)